LRLIGETEYIESQKLAEVIDESRALSRIPSARVATTKKNETIGD
jgi:hypothetical protein